MKVDDSLREERRKTDVEVGIERSKMDTVIDKERDFNEALMTDLLDHERDKTDQRLMEERRHSDSVTREVEAKVAARTSELKEAQLTAETANQTKSEFLANMSHEIRTPLAAIIGFSELLSNPEVNSDDKNKFVAAIKRNGELLATIINDILDLSKVEAGKLEINNREISTAEVATDITVLLGRTALDKGIALNVSTEKNVPKIITTDPLRLKQVLINIIGNAIKFTEKGAVTVKLRFEKKSENSGILAFDVSDTGQGINPSEVIKLFKVFSQADSSSKRHFAGTGLGLALSKNLANLLGGDVVLYESSPQKGSTFTVTIDSGPVLQAQADNDGVRRKVEGAISKVSEISLDGVKVLVVDDSVDNQFLVGWILNQAGAEVETAENGEIAVKKTRHGKYDMVLMDLQMPIKDGYEATEELRREGYRLPIIAVTAYARADDRNYCLAHGFDEHVSKPINRKALIEKIAVLCHQSKIHPNENLSPNMSH